SIIVPGEVQRMSAGTGVLHSEHNPSPREPVHLLQIWIRPDREGVEPGYAQKAFPRADRLNRLRVVATPDGRDGSIAINQDASLFASVLDKGKTLHFDVRPGRHAWLQVARGEIDVNGAHLAQGDGASTSTPGAIDLSASKDTELLLF